VVVGALLLYRDLMRLIGHTRHIVTVPVLTVTIAALLAGTAVIPASATTTGVRAATADLEAALDAAEAAAATASTRVLEAEAAAEAARVAADEAEELFAAVEAAVAEAEEGLAVDGDRFGVAAAGMLRIAGDGPLLARLLTDADPDSLLARLSTLDRVTTLTARSVDAARMSVQTVVSLRAQSRTAAEAHVARVAEAEAAEADARAEADAESEAVARARGELDALYAQLAAARRTSVDQARADRLDEQTQEQAAESPGASGGSAGPGGPAPAPAPAPNPPAAPAPPPVAPPPPATSMMTPAQAQEHARGAVAARGWSDAEFSCLVRLWNRESGWRVDAQNPWSGAYGIPQSLPASKMAAAGADWRTNGATQIAWGLSYIAGRYGAPCGAWAHSESVGWY
jgi:hypothetical protein